MRTNGRPSQVKTATGVHHGACGAVEDHQSIFAILRAAADCHRPAEAQSSVSNAAKRR
jgi:hypothetical protein